MLTVHHLNNSRSQRVLWLLEELGVEYEVRNYERDLETNLAPPELLEIHPLGKSPVLTDEVNTVIESGAIIDYIVRHYGQGRLAPEPGTPAYENYLQWMHYAEGSAMLPLMLKMYTGRLPDGGEALQPRINSELDNHLGFMDRALADQDWFVADTFSAADIQLSFVPQVGKLLYGLDNFPNLAGFLDRIHARPAYKRALERGGPYAFGS
ncbi:glutathione S-transferase family protein [Congregibacter litoralis]|uniref:glutathione transferase n=1 Tax=Congregibacter litoralis KT71 TaxID=314285 RepID=A4AA62_9GAMM|nr:glutathione S-transferase [Congregibacter litoralis]EAQ96939.1 Glutathione S-transferase [Congregibacter litoralis KT71]